jgi:very-short-patch-repair endonuclease
LRRTGPPRGCIRLDGFEAAAIELIVPRESGYRGHIVHRLVELPRVDLTTIDHIRCTTATRTIIDLAAVADADAVAAALESAIRRSLTTPRYLRRRLDALARRGRRGLDRTRAVLADHVGVTDSEMERRYLALSRRVGLPKPVLHHPVGDYVVDLAYPHRRLAIELDGFESHGTKHSFKKDRERQNWLVLQGWTILRFTWDDLRDRPDAVVATVHAAVAA